MEKFLIIALSVHTNRHRLTLHDKPQLSDKPFDHNHTRTKWIYVIIHLCHGRKQVSRTSYQIVISMIQTHPTLWYVGWPGRRVPTRPSFFGCSIYAHKRKCAVIANSIYASLMTGTEMF